MDKHQEIFNEYLIEELNFKFTPVDLEIVSCFNIKTFTKLSKIICDEGMYDDRKDFNNLSNMFFEAYFKLVDENLFGYAEAFETCDLYISKLKDFKLEIYLFKSKTELEEKHIDKFKSYINKLSLWKKLNDLGFNVNLEYRNFN